MFIIEVFTDYKNGWQALKPTHGNRYEFETEEKANETANMCYPDLFGQRERIRVKEI